MNRAVTAMAFVAVMFLLGGCAGTRDGSSGARDESGLGDQDLGPTQYDPRYPTEGDEKPESEDELAPPATNPKSADG